jgi:hypothetical protein
MLTRRRLLAAKHRAMAAGAPVYLTDEPDACQDCSATADLTVHPNGRVDARIFHDGSCPWLRQHVGGGR